MEPLGSGNDCRWLRLFARMSSLSGSRLMACKGGRLCWLLGDFDDDDDDGSFMAGNVSFGDPSEVGIANFRRSGDRIAGKDPLRADELCRLVESAGSASYWLVREPLEPLGPTVPGFEGLRSEGARWSEGPLSPFALPSSDRLDSFERGTCIVGLTRRVLSDFELLCGSSATPPLLLTASSPSRAVCIREYTSLPADLFSSSCIPSSSASDCEAEFICRGSSPAFLAISGLFKSPMILISTSSPWEGSVLRWRPLYLDLPECSGDDDCFR